MRNLAELNINFGGEPVDRPPPTTGIIAAYERQFRLILPDDYVQLLLYSNGGHPEFDLINLRGSDRLFGTGIDSFFYLNEDRRALGGLWSKTEQWRPNIGDNAVPFADDSFGNVYYLDLTTTPAKVMFCDHDQNFAVFEVAPSFSDLIDGLQLDPDAI